MTHKCQTGYISSSKKRYGRELLAKPSNHIPGRIRVPYPFQWGAPTFHAGEAFAMMAASFVALVEVS